jgi:hypothetical protein
MDLRESLGYACLECRQDQRFYIRCYPAWAQVDATEDSYECEEVKGGYDWGETSRAECAACFWKGTVEEMTITCPDAGAQM